MNVFRVKVLDDDTEEWTTEDIRDALESSYPNASFAVYDFKRKRRVI